MIEEKYQKLADGIWGEIEKAQRILLALHVSPDADSAASVLAMALVLRRLGKEVRVISFSQIPSKLLAIPGIDSVEKFDFAKVKFSDYDLFIALDSPDKNMITRSEYPEEFSPGFKIVCIDHHITSVELGDLNLVWPLSSNAEVLYHLFSYWQVEIDCQLARLLFHGLFSDSCGFQTRSTTAATLRAAADLIEKGASLNEVVLANFRSYSLETLRYWAVILKNMQMDESGLFVWSKISREEIEEMEIDLQEIRGAANLFAPIVSGTEFGIILNEESDQLTRGSLRSRSDFDVSQIALALGGGGHRLSAGFSLVMPLEEAQEEVLRIAREKLKLIKTNT